MAFLGLARALASSALISPEPGQAGGARAYLGEPDRQIGGQSHAVRQIAQCVFEDLQVQQPVPLTGSTVASFPLRDHLHQAMMDCHVLAGSLGGLAELTCHPRRADTALTGELDQAGLFGVLNRIMNFGLELTALSRLDDNPASPARLTPRSG